MHAQERIQALVLGQPLDRLPAQPLIMQLAARHAGIHDNDYVTDPRRLADTQMQMADDFGIDCLMTCSDPARELIDIAGGDDGSVEGADSGPAIVESRALLLDRRRLASLRVGPDRIILGNASTVGEMLTGTPEHVYRAAAACHRICGPRHIVGTGCEVSPETPPENLHALVAYAREHVPDAPEAAP